MRFLSNFLAVAAAGLIGGTIAAPVPQTPVDPGDKTDIIITANNTINATRLMTDAPSAGGKLPMSLVNNFAGGAINAYVTGLDSENRLVMLQPDGQFLYPTAASGQEIPQLVTGNIKIPLGPKGSTTNIAIPGYISAARVWFAEGELKFYTVWSTATNGPSLVQPAAVNPQDPSAAVNWGFVELTNNETWGLYANISYVDFVGLILGMSMTETNGHTQSALGLQPDAVASICASLKAQTAKDGQPWGDLCVTGLDGKPLRILAPSNFVASNPDAFKTYWNEYIDNVWEHYTADTLTVNTQAAAGSVDCQVAADGMLKCTGDNRGYAKPTASDIFGCNSGESNPTNIRTTHPKPLAPSTHPTDPPPPQAPSPSPPQTTTSTAPWCRASAPPSSAPPFSPRPAATCSPASTARTTTLPTRRTGTPSSSTRTSSTGAGTRSPTMM